jgi:hypothetical protein
MNGIRIRGLPYRILRKAMGKSIKILHIDGHYEGLYMIIQEGITIRSQVQLKEIITLLKTEEFDLILSEPQNMAILKTADHPINKADSTGQREKNP